MLGPTWWETFAHKINYHEVEDIKINFHGDENQRYQMLLKWSNKYESKATYRIILLALSELSKINTLDKVCQLLHAQSEPGQALPSALERYSDQLKRGYSKYKLKAIVDWPPPPAENIVELAMIGDPQVDEKFIGDMTHGNVQSVLNTKKAIKVAQFYKIIEAGEGKLILLEGAPGSGKTTMCWHICKQWGEGRLFTKFRHILMVELCDKKIQEAK